MPLGPADQGDFARLAGAFSSGPKGLPFFPDHDHPDFERRFYHFYHRLWRAQGGVAGWARPSSSHLIYLPGRLAAQLAGGYFDLALNTFLVLVLLGVALFVTLVRLRDVALTAALSLVALVGADAQVSWYLNSFYQESGAYAATLLLACTLALLVERPRPAPLFLAYVALGLLATTKFAFAPSAVAIGCGVAAALLLDGTSSRPLRAASALLCAALVLGAALFFERERGHDSRANAYNFLFSAALPALPEPERAPFLAAVWVPPAYARLSGTDAYVASLLEERKELAGTLGNAIHARAIVALAASHPGALLAILRDAVREIGKYDIQALGGYGVRPEGVAKTVPACAPWSDLRKRFLHGEVAFVVAAAFPVLLALVALAATTGASGARGARSPTSGAFRRASVVGLSCMGGAALQVALSVLGNGRVDIHKHLYLGNLLYDVGLAFALAAIGLALTSRRRLWSSGGGSVPRDRARAAVTSKER